MRPCPKCGNRHNDIGARTCKLCGSPLPAEASRTTARVASGWRDTSGWKRHQLLRPGAPAIELAMGKTFVFGRASESQLAIQSPKVSRQHAQVEWDGETPYLRDLDSQNGTEVNEKPIRRCKLVDGDEITIGPFTCTYRCLSGRGSLQSAQLENSDADTQELQAVAMSGELGEVTVYELLETLAYNGKTGTLEVFAADQTEGRVTIQEGRATHAEVGNLRGDRAVLHLLSWKTGRFKFATGFDPDLRDNVRGTVQHLLTRYLATLPPDPGQRGRSTPSSE